MCIRDRNIIIHDVDESSDQQKEDSDKNFIDELIKTIRIPSLKIKSMSRIGKKAAEKKRPIKVVLSTEKGKMTLLRNLSSLKGNQANRGISLTEDLTQTERLVLKEWTDKAKNLNLDDSDWVYSCLLYTSPSPRDRTRSRMPSSA